MIKGTIKGTRDIVGEEALLRRKVITILQNVFEKYGFQPFYTPVIEYAEVLKTKISDEILGLMYEFKDKAGRDIGLRYDLTIGLSRYAASNPNLKLPFKRYQIERAWRYEAPQVGRYREFWQADIDILGVENASADAECLACISEALEAIGLKNFVIRVNSRLLLDKIADEVGIGKEKIKVYQTLDKLDKIGRGEVQKELENLIGKDKTKKFFTIIFGKSKKITEDLKELKEYTKSFGIDKKIKIDLTLIRGMGYYTGLVFEIVTEGSNQSIAGGGRYDDLIEKLGGRKIVATGISIGLERVIAILKEKVKELPKTPTQVYIIPISEEQEDYSFKVLQELRKQGINSDISLGKRSIGKCMDYANKLEIPYVLFIGKEEQKQKMIKVKDMKSGKESLMTIDGLRKTLE